MVKMDCGNLSKQLTVNSVMNKFARITGLENFALEVKAHMPEYN